MPTMFWYVSCTSIFDIFILKSNCHDFLPDFEIKSKTDDACKETNYKEEVLCVSGVKVYRRYGTILDWHETYKLTCILDLFFWLKPKWTIEKHSTISNSKSRMSLLQLPESRLVRGE